MDVNNQESAPDVTSTSASPTATGTRMKKTIADRAADAKETIDNFGRMAADKLENSRESTATALHKTASSLHSGADQVSDFGHTAAEKLHATADYVRNTDLDLIVQDLQTTVKRYPIQSLAAAAFLGFLVARGFSRR